MVKQKQHGVEVAFYSNLPGPEQTAWLECLCGEQFTGNTRSWEDAGRAMDEHLAEVRTETEIPDPPEVKDVEQATSKTK